LTQGIASSTARHLPGYTTEAKAIGLEALAPCVTSSHPEIDLPEAKQDRLCLLPKSGLGN